MDKVYHDITTLDVIVIVLNLLTVVFSILGVRNARRNYKGIARTDELLHELDRRVEMQQMELKKMQKQIDEYIKNPGS